MSFFFNMFFEEGKMDKYVLSSGKVMLIEEDNLLLWIMKINNNNTLDIKNYSVLIEEDIEVDGISRLFNRVSLIDFLKERRPEFYEKYKLLLC